MHVLPIGKRGSWTRWLWLAGLWAGFAWAQVPPVPAPPRAPRHAQDVRDHVNDKLEALTHLFLLNRGVLLTPFHGMLLLSPATTSADVDRLLDGMAALVALL